MQGARDSTNQRRVYVDQSEEGICWPIRAKELEIGPIRAFLPECNARYPWLYKRHRAFISPIPFSDTVQKWRWFVHEIGKNVAELSKNASDTSRGLESSDNSPRCNWRVLYGGATYRLELQCYHLAVKSERQKKQQHSTRGCWITASIGHDE